MSSSEESVPLFTNHLGDFLSDLPFLDAQKDESKSSEPVKVQQPESEVKEPFYYLPTLPQSFTPQQLDDFDVFESSEPLVIEDDAQSNTNSHMWFDEFDSRLYSRKVFVGKLPHFATQHSYYGQAVQHIFRRFGDVEIEWPKPATHPSSSPSPRLTGYFFLVYKSYEGLRQMVRRCTKEDNGELYLDLGPGLEDVQLHIRLWRLADADYCFNDTIPVSPSLKTVFLGRLPRMCTAKDIAMLMQERFGLVLYVQIDVDSQTKYPQGCAAVFFAKNRSYFESLQAKRIDLSAIAGRKWYTEVKPFVCLGGICDECQEAKSQHFCPDIACLQYFCRDCWNKMHSQPWMLNHHIYTEALRRDDPHKKIYSAYSADHQQQRHANNRRMASTNSNYNRIV